MRLLKVLFPLIAGFAIVFCILQSLGHIQAAQAAPSTSTIYVDVDNVSGTYNGNTWGSAYQTLQDALAVAVNGDEIWVAAGAYYPDEGTGQTSDALTSTFNLKSGVAIYGGFSGDETSLGQRDWQTNLTVLSGDIDNNDTTDLNNIVTDTGYISGGNAYHVLMSNGLTETAVLDGFTITAGRANGSGININGAGMYNSGSSPTLINLTYIGNWANNLGGGIYNINSSPTLTNLIFRNNKVTLHGAAIYNSNSNSILRNILFTGNLATDGAGIFNTNNSHITLNQVTFRSNSGRNGVGMYNNTSNPTLTNVVFSGNTGVYFGGGMYNSGGNPTLTNVSFNGNSVTNTSGGGYYNSSGDPTFTNCILWGNTAPSGPNIYVNGGTPAITYSDVQGGYAGTGNINDNPDFMNPANGNLRLLPGSPAIDTGINTGCPADDLDGVSRPIGASCDMGAYEFSGILFVDADTTGAATGISWTDAFTNLQDALSIAVSGNQIWVAEGVYYPDQGVGQTDNDQNSAFAMKNGVEIYGGFAATETLRSERDLSAHIAVLSGDIDGNDTTDSYHVVTDTANIAGSNAYHVIKNSSINNTALLDGFTITAGRANVGSAIGQSGAGIYNSGSSPALNNLTIIGNWAGVYGGGIYNQLTSTPTVSRTLFTSNKAGSGGGLYNNGGSSTLINVIFRNNNAINGGGIFNGASDSILTNVTFYGNSASSNGGGIYNITGSDPTLTNCILWGNSASSGSEIYDLSSTPIVNYSIVQGGYAGTGNLDEDPTFVDQTNGNLHLQIGSPGIDKGTSTGCPADDLDGVLRPIGSACDMGAYELEFYGIIYVDGDATGAATGLSWTDAFTNPQNALVVAQPGYEIWVAEGIYYPDQGTGQTSGVLTSTFALTKGVGLYGGFDATETIRTERDWETHLTVLSGDIDHNDTTDPYGVVTHTSNITGTNAHHIITSQNVTETAVLDGFTITAGYANGTNPYQLGAGMYNINGSPSLANLVFSSNWAWYGAGIYNREDSNPTLLNLTFNHNAAKYNGGGMYNYDSNPFITQTLFYSNTAVDEGGGVWNFSYSSPTLADVTFDDNDAVKGGGMYNYSYSNPNLTDVTFSNNTATHGGGIYNYWYAEPNLNQVTFFNNSAANGGGMHTTYYSDPILTDVTFIENSGSNGGGMYNDNTSSPILTNCIFQGNTAAFGAGIYNHYRSSPNLVNCLFFENVANQGAGLYNYDQSNPTLKNVTLSENSAGFGGGLYNTTNSNPNLINTILWGNNTQIYNFNGSYANAVYSDIQGGYGGSTNLNNDPLFVDPDNGNFRLQVNSPAIDAGQNISMPATDLDGNPRFVDIPTVPDWGSGTAPIIDMGPYEVGYSCLIFIPLVSK